MIWIWFPRPTAEVICRAAIRLGVFAYLLFLVSSNVDGYFEGQALPDQLTARNITITLRTVVRGLSYLMTFLLAANTVGLTGKPFLASHVLSLPAAPTQLTAMPISALSRAAICTCLALDNANMHLSESLVHALQWHSLPH